MQNGQRRFLSRFEIGTLAASATAIAFGLAYAGPSPHMIDSLFGIAPTESVRISVVSNDIPEIRGDDHKLAASPCYVQLKVFGSDGSIALQSDLLKIDAGAALSHDLKYEDLKIGVIKKSSAVDFNNRVQVRVASYVSGDGLLDSKLGHKVAGCMQDYKLLKLSVEVFDNASGKTSFMVPTDSLLPAVQ